MRPPFPAFVLVAWLVSSLAAVAALRAQCVATWQPGDTPPGTDGAVYAWHAWDPDGIGAVSELWVAGGAFRHVGNANAANVALRDPSGAWVPLGSGCNGPVHAFTVLGTGHLLVGGSFTLAGGVPVNGLAAYDGASWQQFAGVTGAGAAVYAFARLATGELVIAGSFTHANGVAAANLAAWNGSTWAPIGTGTDGPVHSLAVLATGALVATGWFATAGSVPAANVARWDGSSWSDVSGGLGNAGGPYPPRVVSVGSGFVVAGVFSSAGGVAAANVARWTGTQWVAIGAGLSPVRSLTARAAGNVFASTDTGVYESALANWNVIHPVCDGAIGLGPNDHVGVQDTTVPPSLRAYDGTTWSPLVARSGLNALVRTVAPLRNGDWLVGGDFFAVNGQAARVAKWQSQTWTPVFGNGATDAVSQIVVGAGGDLLVAGRLSPGARVLVRVSGASVTMLGNLPNSNQRAHAVLPLPNGDVIVGGSFSALDGVAFASIARWDGSAWHPLTSGVSAGTGHVAALALHPSGAVFAAGGFLFAGGVAASGIATWQGGAWQPLGSGLDAAAYAIAIEPDGDVLVGGQFVHAGGVVAPGIARWNGVTWSPLGSGTNGAVRAMTVLGEDDVIVAGDFSVAGGVAAARVARWRGGVWQALDGGLHGAPFAQAHAVAVGPTGEIAVGGVFTTAGSEASLFFARLVSTCPATVQPFGAGCTSSAGPVALTAAAGPWLGGTLTTTASGIPGNSIVLAVYGLGPAVTPLGAILPQGGVGCTLLVTPDLVVAGVPGATGFSTTLAIPDTASLVAQQFRHQIAPLTFAAGGTLTEFTASNALVLTIGSL